VEDAPTTVAVHCLLWQLALTVVLLDAPSPIWPIMCSVGR